MKKRYYLFMLAVLAVLQACKSGGGLFRAASPHEMYRQRLIAAGLDKTDLGANWINSSVLSNQNALRIDIPFKESGYFPAERTPANAYRFMVTKGQKLMVSIKQKTTGHSMLYLDIWEITANGNKKLASADTLGNVLELEIDENAEYLMRLQPQLLQSVSYTLDITVGPSLGFPTRTGRNNIKSFWGDGRDGDTRKHEGIDIFGLRGSPVVATSKGRVTRVNENNLGGRVVWMRPEGKDYTLYYAHLDEQLAVEGQQVAQGDTLGLMGNTGNARTTSPHLHFGIYTSSGAVNPLPFIDPQIKQAPPLKARVTNLNKTMRTVSDFTLKGATQDSLPARLPKGTVVIVNTAHSDSYTVELPDGRTGQIDDDLLEPVNRPLKTIKVAALQSALYDAPRSNAAVKTTLIKGQSIKILGNFQDYHLVSSETSLIGWMMK